MKKESNPSPKKKWARPKLIILTRGKPEEGVLVACKLGLYMAGVGDWDTGCIYASICGPCIAKSAS